MIKVPTSVGPIRIHMSQCPRYAIVRRITFQTSPVEHTPSKRRAR
jgi:hypothetical protein